MASRRFPLSLRTTSPMLNSSSNKSIRCIRYVTDDAWASKQNHVISFQLLVLGTHHTAAVIIEIEIKDPGIIRELCVDAIPMDDRR